MTMAEFHGALGVFFFCQAFYGVLCMDFLIQSSQQCCHVGTSIMLMLQIEKA